MCKVRNSNTRLTFGFTLPFTFPIYNFLCIPIFKVSLLLVRVTLAIIGNTWSVFFVSNTWSMVSRTWSPLRHGAARTFRAVRRYRSGDHLLETILQVFEAKIMLWVRPIYIHVRVWRKELINTIIPFIIYTVMFYPCFKSEFETPLHFVL